MVNYYQILGVTRFAKTAEIKAAYKKLALQYHPDRNPNNTAAEEYFKMINEAYQVLGDSDKRAQYDFLLNYSYQSTASPVTPRQTRARPSERSVYDRYGPYDWRKAPRYRKAPVYKIDKDYIRHQVLAFVAVGILAAFVLGSMALSNYLREREQQALQARNLEILTQARQLYNNGNYRESMDMVIKLMHDNPMEYQFDVERDRMVEALNQAAVLEFSHGQFKGAASKLEIVRDYQHPLRLATWQTLADCYYQMGEYRKSVHAYEYVLIRDDGNVPLMIKIADIHLEHLNNKQKALDYLSEARFRFKELQTANYGEAYELIVRPEYIPEIYYTMFTKRAQLNFELQNYHEAIKDCNWAIFLKPDVGMPYFVRAKSRFEEGSLARACKDIKKAEALGESIPLQDKVRICL